MRSDEVYGFDAASLIHECTGARPGYTIYPSAGGVGIGAVAQLIQPKTIGLADWRKDSISDWRQHRNDWNENYSKEYERKEFAKRPSFR